MLGLLLGLLGLEERESGILTKLENCCSWDGLVKELTGNMSPIIKKKNKVDPLPELRGVVRTNMYRSMTVAGTLVPMYIVR